MPMERFSFTREQIYAAVWSEPMRDACKQFGVTAVALAKVCRRLNVPRPRQGHWLRKSIGHEPPKKALPAAGADTPLRWEGERWVEPAPEPPRPATEKLPPPRLAVEPMVVPETIGKLHPRLAGAMNEIRKASKQIWEFRRWRRTVPVVASEAALDRALRIMNALMFALEGRDWKVEVRAERDASPDGGRYQRAATGVHVGDAFVEFYMVERTTMVRLKPLPKLKRPLTTDEYLDRFARKKLEYRPNGMLSIEVDQEYGGAVAWTDKRNRRLEDCLHEVVAGIAGEAESIRARRIEHARNAEEARQLAIRREQAQRVAEKQRIEAEGRRREEEEKVAKLRVTLADWREVRDTRAFIEEARAIVAAAGQVIEEGSRLDKFIKWATARNDRFDPLRELRREAAECAKAAASSEGHDRSP